MRADISTLVTIVVVAVVVYFRMLRPVRLRRSRIWIGPAVMVVLTVLVASGSYVERGPLLFIVLAIVVGAVLGVPLGLLRGRHTRVRQTENPHVLVVQPSGIPLAIWFVAFLARFGIKYFLPHAGPMELVWSDGLLAFAVGTVIGARYMIAQKFRELHA